MVPVSTISKRISPSKVLTIWIRLRWRRFCRMIQASERRQWQLQSSHSLMRLSEKVKRAYRQKTKKGMRRKSSRNRKKKRLIMLRRIIRNKINPRIIKSMTDCTPTAWMPILRSNPKANHQIVPEAHEPRNTILLATWSRESRQSSSSPSCLCLASTTWLIYTW